MSSHHNIQGSEVTVSRNPGISLTRPFNIALVLAPGLTTGKIQGPADQSGIISIVTTCGNVEWFRLADRHVPNIPVMSVRFWRDTQVVL
jgi:hypothetical protein